MCWGSREPLVNFSLTSAPPPPPHQNYCQTFQTKLFHLSFKLFFTKPSLRKGFKGQENYWSTFISPRPPFLPRIKVNNFNFFYFTYLMYAHVSNQVSCIINHTCIGMTLLAISIQCSFRMKFVALKRVVWGLNQS